MALCRQIGDNENAMHGIQTAAGSDAIAPDTTGLNFFSADPSLADLLQLYLSDKLYAHIAPHLDRLGALAGDHLDQCARLADKHTPVLHHRDRFGRDEQWIEFHPAYRELERVAYGEFGIHAMSHRKGILGWPDTYPSAAKHAFTYLFNQAEFGLGCPINVTDGAAMLLSRFGDDALKAKYLDGLTQTDMTRLTQGAQFMTEKEGGSDVGKLTTVADSRRRSLAPHRREMVLLERGRRGGDAARAARRRASWNARRRPVPDAAPAR